MIATAAPTRRGELSGEAAGGADDELLRWSPLRCRPSCGRRSRSCASGRAIRRVVGMHHRQQATCYDLNCRSPAGVITPVIGLSGAMPTLPTSAGGVADACFVGVYQTRPRQPNRPSISSNALSLEITGQAISMAVAAIMRSKASRARPAHTARQHRRRRRAGRDGVAMGAQNHQPPSGRGNPDSGRPRRQPWRSGTRAHAPRGRHASDGRAALASGGEGRRRRSGRRACSPAAPRLRQADVRRRDVCRRAITFCDGCVASGAACASHGP